MQQLAADDSASFKVLPVIEPVILKDNEESIYSRDPSFLLRSEDINNLTSSRNSNIQTMKLDTISVRVDSEVNHQSSKGFPPKASMPI